MQTPQAPNTTDRYRKNQTCIKLNTHTHTHSHTQGHLVREIDALDGIMGRIIDEAGASCFFLKCNSLPAMDTHTYIHNQTYNLPSFDRTEVTEKRACTHQPTKRAHRHPLQNPQQPEGPGGAGAACAGGSRLVSGGDAAGAGRHAEPGDFRRWACVCMCFCVLCMRVVVGWGEGVSG
jgi:hypothetical protein